MTFVTETKVYSVGHAAQNDCQQCLEAKVENWAGGWCKMHSLTGPPAWAWPGLWHCSKHIDPWAELPTRPPPLAPCLDPSSGYCSHSLAATTKFGLMQSTAHMRTKNHVLILTCLIGAARKHFWPNEPLLRGARWQTKTRFVCAALSRERDREAANTFRGVCAITSSKLRFFAE